MLRWIENCIVKQCAWLYYKFHNAQGKDFSRAVVVELDVVEIMRRGWSVLFELVTGRFQDC